MIVLAESVEVTLNPLEVLDFHFHNGVTVGELVDDLTRLGDVDHVSVVAGHIEVNHCPDTVGLAEKVRKVIWSGLYDIFEVRERLDVLDNGVALEDTRVEAVPITLLEVYVEMGLIIRLKVELSTSDKVGDVTNGATLDVGADVGKVRYITVVHLVDELVVCTEDGRLCCFDAAEYEFTVNY